MISSPAQARLMSFDKLVLAAWMVVWAMAASEQ
jgi:hypothetical protein